MEGDLLPRGTRTMAVRKEWSRQEVQGTEQATGGVKEDQYLPLRFGDHKKAQHQTRRLVGTPENPRWEEEQREKDLQESDGGERQSCVPEPEDGAGRFCTRDLSKSTATPKWTRNSTGSLRSCRVRWKKSKKPSGLWRSPHKQFMTVARSATAWRRRDSERRAALHTQVYCEDDHCEKRTIDWHRRQERERAGVVEECPHSAEKVARRGRRGRGKFVNKVEELKT